MITKIKDNVNVLEVEELARVGPLETEPFDVPLTVKIT